MISIAKPEELEALSSLEHNHNFKVVMGWLQRSLDETVEQLKTNHDEVSMRRAQGASVDLTEIIDMSKRSRKIIEKSKR